MRNRLSKRPPGSSLPRHEAEPRFDLAVRAVVVIDRALEQELGLRLRRHRVERLEMVLRQHVRGRGLRLPLQAEQLGELHPGRAGVDGRHQQRRHHHTGDRRQRRARDPAGRSGVLMGCPPAAAIRVPRRPPAKSLRRVVCGSADDGIVRRMFELSVGVRALEPRSP